jgi:4-amino-4-deoxy-L-arabinose transferase-like glycosyltransferase
LSKVKKKNKKYSIKKSARTETKHLFFGVKTESIQRLISFIFLVTFTVLFISFLVRLSNSPDFKSQIIQSVRGLIAAEYIICTLIASCFGYFGWRYFRGVGEFTRIDRIILGVTVASVAAVYIGAFTKDISPNGDNAEYLILAKSLVERGAPLRLESPNETPNSLASLGLPIMLAPIYKIWGFDLVKMKMLMTTLALLVFPMLIYLFRRRHSYYLSILLALTCVTSPYLVGSSTDTMTETPYIFWSILTIILLLKFAETKGLNIKYFLLSMIGISMTFLTRSVGIGLLVAAIIYLTVQVKWQDLLKPDTRKNVFTSDPFKRLLVIVVPLFIGAVALQIWQQSRGVSQAAMFFSFNIFQLLEQNMTSASHVLGQMLMSAETYRFESFFPSASLPKTNLAYVVLMLVTLWGFIVGFRKRDLTAFYTVIVFLIIMVASNTPAEMVVIRYLSVLLPFIIYYTYLGVVSLLDLILSTSPLKPLAKFGGVLFLVLLLMVNLSGDAVNIAKSSVGNGPAYDDFIDVAKWAKRNLPDDALVMSIKPRLFYVLSDKKGVRLGVQGEEYTPELEREQLELFRKEGITHLILDGVSGSTRRNIFPIVKNNPEMFQTMYIGSKSSSSSVQKIIYKTE